MDQNPNDIYLRGSEYPLDNPLDASLDPIERPASGLRLMVSGGKWTRVSVLPRKYHIRLLSGERVWMQVNNAAVPALPSDVSFDFSSNTDNEVEFLPIEPGEPIDVHTGVSGFVPLLYFRCTPGGPEAVILIVPIERK